MRKTFRAESLSSFVQIVRDIRDGWRGSGYYFDPWFRGQENSKWGLTPGIFLLGLEEEEHEIRAEFIRLGRQLVGEIEPKNQWEWYFLMQHHRAPTRLLDWTTSSLTGLFFAVNTAAPGQQVPKHDAAVWVLDPWWLNSQVIGRRSIVLDDWPEAQPYLPRPYYHSLRRKWPLAIDPPHVARRIATQHAHFTIHGRDPDGLMSLWRKPRSRLAKIILPTECIEEIRVDLFTCGITDSTLFPDLEGLSRELARYFTDTFES